MDLNIVVSAIVPFICFLCVLPILFRVSAESKSTQYMLYIAIVGIVQSIGIWVYFGLNAELSIMNIWIGGVYVIAIYALLVLLFLLGIFSIFEASLTLRFLLEIASGENGISNQALLSKYGVVKIIQRRLERMIASGDLLHKGNAYTLGKTQSYFRIREHLLTVFWNIFP